MNSKIAELMSRISHLEGQLEAELAKRRAELNFGLEHGRVVFEQEVARRHRELRVSLGRYLLKARFFVVITAPVIYSMIIPLALLDLFVTVYQLVCFPAYGITKVDRRDYLIFDRHHLSYLNSLEKLNCAYCSYANGLIAYTREIAARTELHWCPIKHARRVLGAHGAYHEFDDFGDAEAHHKRLKAIESADDMSSSAL
jgi:hypothetical protein